METTASLQQRAPSPTAVLVEERVRLRPVSARDLPSLEAWDEDLEIATLMGRRFIAQSPEEWLQSLRSGRSYRAWMVTLAERVVGEVELAQINHHKGTAEIRICIGERDCWGRGIGGQAMAQVLDFAFASIRLRTIYLRVFANNHRAIALYKRLGFRTEAVMQPSARRGDPAPVMLMKLMARRWRAQSSGLVG